MRTLVLGGIRSGKSAWAEAQVAAEGSGIRYVATGARDDDEDWAARVAAHRERRPSDWKTVESTDVAGELSSEAVPTLVDDVGGWLVAAMDRGEAWSGGSVRDDVARLVAAVAAFTAPLVLVSPEVGLSLVPPTKSGRLFADALGDLNQQLAGACDRVALVVAGQALIVKEPS